MMRIFSSKRPAQARACVRHEAALAQHLQEAAPSIVCVTSHPCAPRLPGRLHMPLLGEAAAQQRAAARKRRGGRIWRRHVYTSPGQGHSLLWSHSQGGAAARSGAGTRKTTNVGGRTSTQTVHTCLGAGLGGGERSCAHTCLGAGFGGRRRGFARRRTAAPGPAGRPCHACLGAGFGKGWGVRHACAQQRRVQQVGAVGGGHEHDALLRREAVHLAQQLVQSLLALLVRLLACGVYSRHVIFVTEFVICSKRICMFVLRKSFLTAARMCIETQLLPCRSPETPE